ncbi:MAG: SH3 domain-containing protein [Moorea sp. SIO4A3]|nr:SH3 domain-containing protein [Moorena sp. SIO4A3]
MIGSCNSVTKGNIGDIDFHIDHDSSGVQIIPAPKQTGKPPTVVKNTCLKVDLEDEQDGYLIVRSDANSSAREIGRLYHGEAITVSREEGKWGYLEEVQGWIHLGLTDECKGISRSRFARIKNT